MSERKNWKYRFKKSFPYFVYLSLTQRDMDKVYEYFYDIWPEFFKLMPGEMKYFFMNFGLWLPKDTVAPMQRMHMYIQEKSNIKPTDRILDIGSGFGGQNLLCYEKYQPEEIVGLEINKKHVDYCKEQVLKLGLENKIRYIHGSAEKFPAEIPKNYFDKVFALHCLYHLPKRSDFFREAYESLKPGGQLIIVDNYLKRLPKDELEQKMIDFDIKYFKTKEPYYTEEQLLKELSSVGFHSPHSDSLIQNIFPPFYQFMLDKRTEIEATCKRLYYPKFFVRLCYQGAELMKKSVEQGLYESAVLKVTK